MFSRTDDGGLSHKHVNTSSKHGRPTNHPAQNTHTGNGDIYKLFVHFQHGCLSHWKLICKADKTKVTATCFGHWGGCLAIWTCITGERKMVAYFLRPCFGSPRSFMIPSDAFQKMELSIFNSKMIPKWCPEAGSLKHVYTHGFQNGAFVIEIGNWPKLQSCPL